MYIRVCMCVYVYVYMRVCVRARARVCVCVCVRACVRMYVCMCIGGKRRRKGGTKGGRGEQKAEGGSYLANSPKPAAWLPVLPPSD